MEVLASQPRTTAQRPLPASADAGWAWLGWFGLALAVLGFGDILLTWIPSSFGNWQWEFGTVAGTFAGLPLTTIGLAGLMGSALARGRRWQLLVLAATFVALGLLIVTALILFLLDVPLAFRAAQGPASLGIKKAVIKTTMLGAGFAALYLAAGLAAVRRLREASRPTTT